MFGAEADLMRLGLDKICEVFGRIFVDSAAAKKKLGESRALVLVSELGQTRLLHGQPTVVRTRPVLRADQPEGTAH